MSNPLIVRRVQFQNLQEDGQPDGPPMFGVIASDNTETTFDNSYESLEDLNKAINEAPSILAIIHDHQMLFPDANHNKIGKENYYGKDWFYEDEDDMNEDEEDEDEDF